MSKQFKQLSNELKQSNQNLIKKVQKIQKNIPMYQKENNQMEKSQTVLNYSQVQNTLHQYDVQKSHIKQIALAHFTHITQTVTKLFYKIDNLLRYGKITTEEHDVLQHKIINLSNLARVAIQNSEQVALFPLKNELSFVSTHALA